jgi:acyl carrier protein
LPEVVGCEGGVKSFSRSPIFRYHVRVESAGLEIFLIAHWAGCPFFAPMNKTEVIARLQILFNDIFLEPPRLTPTLTAAEVPEWDSLIHISLLVAIEKDFGISFQTGEVEATKNVGEMADLILRRKAEA